MNREVLDCSQRQKSKSGPSKEVRDSSKSPVLLDMTYGKLRKGYNMLLQNCCYLCIIQPFSSVDQCEIEVSNSQIYQHTLLWDKVKEDSWFQISCQSFDDRMIIQKNLRALSLRKRRGVCVYKNGVKYSNICWWRWWLICAKWIGGWYLSNILDNLINHLFTTIQPEIGPGSNMLVTDVWAFIAFYMDSLDIWMFTQ